MDFPNTGHERNPQNIVNGFEHMTTSLQVPYVTSHQQGITHNTDMNDANIHLDNTACYGGEGGFGSKKCLFI